MLSRGAAFTTRERKWEYVKRHTLPVRSVHWASPNWGVRCGRTIRANRPPRYPTSTHTLVSSGDSAIFAWSLNNIRSAWLTISGAKVPAVVFWKYWRTSRSDLTLQSLLAHRTSEVMFPHSFYSRVSRVFSRSARLGCCAAVNDLLKATRQPVKANMFLLQPQPGANAIVAQIVVEGFFCGC